MKKVILAVFLATTTIGVFAQHQPAKHFSVIPHLNLGFVKNVGEVKDFSINLNNGFNVSVGAEARYQFNNWFAVGAALDFGHMQTFKQNSEFYYPDPTLLDPTNMTLYSGRLHYEFYDVSLPLTAHFNISRHLSVYTGVQLSFALDADVFLTDNTVEGNEDAYDIDLKKDINRFNVFIPVGVRWTFDTPWELALQFNFQTTRWNKAPEQGCKDARSFPIMLTAGYRFDL